MERVLSAEGKWQGEDAAAFGLENSEAATKHSKVRWGELSNGSHTIDSKKRRAAYAECHGKRKQHALLRNESAEAAAALLRVAACCG